MKKIFTFTIFLIILALSLTYFKPALSQLLSYSICDQPISYKVDTVDPKFNLSRDEFLDDVNKATQIWNKTLSKNLFVYDPKGSLSINLIYDERQSLTQEVNQLENTVKQQQQTIKPEVDQYKKLSLDLKQKLDALNKEVEYWNNKGGAPPQEYKKIVQDQQDLKIKANSLNTMAQNLNSSTDVYNSQVGQLNQTISSLDSALQERPEEGVFKYPENIIEIYFDINNQELIHTLAHELGHSIGLKHINNPKAIMYFRTNQSLTPSSDDIQALENICRRHSIFELIQNYITNLHLLFFPTLI